MTSITNTDRNHRLHVVFDDKRTAPVKRYTIWIEGQTHVVIAEPWESPDTVWQRVLDLVANIRATLWRDTWRGNEHHFATVYADIKPTEQQRKEHEKDRFSACLYRLADPTLNKDAYSRVQALIFLSELHGLNQCQTALFALPSLEQVEVEIARRKAQ